MTCPGVGLFASIIIGTLGFLHLHVYFLHQCRVVFFIYSNRFPISCSFSPSDTPMMRCCTSWGCLRSCLYYPHFLDSFFFLLFWLFVFCLFVFLFFASSCSKSSIWFLASFTALLFPCKLFFISVSESFVSDWVFFMLLRSSLSSLSIVINSALNSASDRLLISKRKKKGSGCSQWFLNTCCYDALSPVSSRSLPTHSPVCATSGACSMRSLPALHSHALTFIS